MSGVIRVSIRRLLRRFRGRIFIVNDRIQIVLGILKRKLRKRSITLYLFSHSFKNMSTHFSDRAIKIKTKAKMKASKNSKTKSNPAATPHQ